MIPTLRNRVRRLEQHQVQAQKQTLGELVRQARLGLDAMSPAELQAMSQRDDTRCEAALTAPDLPQGTIGRIVQECMRQRARTMRGRP